MSFTNYLKERIADMMSREVERGLGRETNSSKNFWTWSQDDKKLRFHFAFIFPLTGWG